MGSDLGKLIKRMLINFTNETSINRVEKLFIEIDDDGDGRVSKDELLEGIEEYYSFFDEKLIEVIEETFDDD